MKSDNVVTSFDYLFIIIEFKSFNCSKDLREEFKIYEKVFVDKGNEKYPIAHTLCMISF